MTAKRHIVALLLALYAMPVQAQTMNEDVRCLVLSNLYSKGAANDQARGAAVQAKAFFLGRLDGRTDTRTLGEALRHETAVLNPKASGPLMTACAGRVARAERSLQAVGRAMAPKK
ncbi:MAG: hypothetical protein NVSMB6_10560 [Burkholderiaceae bacterium]